MPFFSLKTNQYNALKGYFYLIIILTNTEND